MDIKRVMMVDDDPSIRMVAGIALTRIGNWESTLLDSGQKALDLFREYRPDVILLDVMMPGMDGITTFRRLIEAGLPPSTPVIFMTAKVQRQEIQSYCELGAAGVIIKPFDPLRLAEEIRQIASRANKVKSIA